MSSLAAEAANDDVAGAKEPIKRFGNIIIGFVGYLGSGCSEIAAQLESHFIGKGFSAKIIKASKLIENHYPNHVVKKKNDENDGEFKLRRTESLQDLGDRLRHDLKNNAAVSGLALKEIKSLREQSDESLESKTVYLIDSLKHPSEVDALRRLYGGNFRLISVFSDRVTRESRLIGNHVSRSKFRGTDAEQVSQVMDRDEADSNRKNGQQVRRTFYLGDFFLNNNKGGSAEIEIQTGLTRFVELITGKGIHRPTPEEYGMYHAFSASLHSSCLSRQVGAVLVGRQGTIISTGMNDVPKFGGGTYDGNPNDEDNRCFVWEYKQKDSNQIFIGCHKDRKNIELRNEIEAWITTELLGKQSSLTVPQQKKVAEEIRKSAAKIEKMPGVGDIIEYSRSIHAEMDAISACARVGISTQGAKLYCTTYPCHNCARHLVAAGVEEVYYIEPYVKSQAIDLHSDSIGDSINNCETTVSNDTVKKRIKMLVSAFTGVGPRMYEDHFIKRQELKKASGEYNPPEPGNSPVTAIPIGNLMDNEEASIEAILGGSIT